MDPMLSPEQIRTFERDGFLVLPGFASPETCKRLRERADELVSDFDPGQSVTIFTTKEQSRATDDYFLGSADKVRFFFEEDAFTESGELRQEKSKSINKIGHALHQIDPVFREFSTSERVRSVIGQIGPADPLVIQSMFIFKQPRIGGEVNWHQDATFLHTEPVSVRGFWLGLEDANRENGCLWAIPGGHKGPLKSRWMRDPDDVMSFEVYDESPWDTKDAAPLEVEAGTLVVLHGLLPHMSLANTSSQSRHAYTLHAISRSADYPETNWLRIA